MIRKIDRADGTRWQVYGQNNGDKLDKNGKPKREKVYVGTFDSRRAALEAEEDYRTTQRKIDRGELPRELDLDRKLREAVTEWLKSLEQRGSRSHENYEERMRMYILPKLGDVAIARMSKTHVMRYRDEMATRFAPATVNGNLTCLSSAFSYFVDRDWVAVNPCHGVDQVERPETVYTWIQTREEITKLLLECPKGIREIVTLGIGTGMRLDELLHLRWADVDIERRLIAVHRGRKGTVKSGKARRVPVLDAFLPWLRALALNRDGAELVFQGEKGKARSKPGVRFPFKQACLRAGLPKALRFHDLRHTFASHWVLDGGDIFRLSKILGHSSVLVTQKVYAHLVPEAWEQDYARIAVVVPEDGAAYATTKRKAKPEAPAAPVLRLVG